MNDENNEYEDFCNRNDEGNADYQSVLDEVTE